MPKTFAEVYDLFRGMQADGSLPAETNLKSFSRMANDVTDSNEFDSGTGSWLGQQAHKADYWIDKGLEKTGLPDITGSLMSKAFEYAGGTPETGRALGEALPRGFVDYGSLFIPGAEEIGAPRALKALASLREPLAMGMSALNTFGKTDSVGRAGLSAAMLPIMGKGGEMASGLAARLGLVTPIEKSAELLTAADNPTSKLVVQKVLEGGDKITNFIAHQIGAIGAAEATNYAVDAYQAGSFNPHPDESMRDKLLGITLGNAPYMLSGAVSTLRAEHVPIGKSRTVETEPQQDLGPAPAVSDTDRIRITHALDYVNGLDAAKAETDPTKRKELEQLAARDYQYKNDVLDGKQTLSDYNPADLPPEVQEIKATHELSKVYDRQSAIEAQLAEMQKRQAENDPTPLEPLKSPLQDLAEKMAALRSVQPEKLKTAEDIGAIKEETRTLAEVAKVEPPTQEHVDAAVESNVESGDTPGEAAANVAAGVHEEVKQQSVEKLTKEESHQQGLFDYFEKARTAPDEIDKQGYFVLKKAIETSDVPAEKLIESYQKFKAKLGERPFKVTELAAYLKTTAENLTKPELRGRIHEAGPFETLEEADKFASYLNKNTADNESKDIDAWVPAKHYGKWRVESKHFTEEGKKQSDAIRTDVRGKGRPVTKTEPSAETKVAIEPLEKIIKSKPKNAVEKQAAEFAKSHLQKFLEEHTDAEDLLGQEKLKLIKATLASGKLDAELVLQHLSDQLDVMREKAAKKDTLAAARSSGGGLTEAERAGILARPKRRSLIPDRQEVLNHVLRLSGFSEKDIAYFGPKLERIASWGKDFDSKVGLLRNDDPNDELYGLASMRSRMVWLSAIKGVDKENTFWHQAVILGHELGHVIEGSFNRGELEDNKHTRAYKRWVDLAHTKPDEAHGFLMNWFNALPEKFRNLQTIREVMDNKDPNEIIANAHGLYTLHRLGKEEGHVLALTAPPEAKGFLATMSSMFKKLIGAIRADRFLHSNDYSADFSRLVDDFNKNTDGMLESIRKSDQSMQDLQRALKLSSQDVFDLSIAAIRRDGDGEFIDPLFSARAKDKNYKGTGEKVWDYMLRNLHGLGDQVPAFKTVVSSVFNHGAMQDALKVQALAPHSGGLTSDGKLTTRGKTAELYRAVQRPVNGKLNRVLSDAAQWWQQNHESEPFDMAVVIKENPEWPPGVRNPKRLGDQLRNLSDYEKQANANWFDREMESQRITSKNTVAAHNEAGQSLLATYLQSELPEDRWSQSLPMARQLHAAFEKVTTQVPDMQSLMLELVKADPKASPQELATKAQQRVQEAMDLQKQGQTDLAVLRARLTVNKSTVDATGKTVFVPSDHPFQEALGILQDVKNGAEQLKAMSKPGHLSMMRSGKWKVTAMNSKDPDQKFVDLLQKREDFQIWKKNAKEQGFDVFDEPVPHDETKNFGLDDNTLQVVNSLEERMIQRIDAMQSVSDDMKSALKDAFSVQGTLARAQAGRDVTQSARQMGIVNGQRQKVPGSMDMVETQKLFHSTAARINATKIMRARIAFELTNPELQRFPDDVKQFRAQLDNYMRPDSDLQRGLQRFNSLYYLGGSISAPLMNLTQSHTVGIPEAVARGIGFVKAATMMNGALWDAAKYSANVLASKAGFVDEGRAINRIKDSLEKRLFRKFHADGHLSAGTFSELLDTNADASVDLHYLTEKDATMKLGDKMKSGVTNFQNMTMKAFAASETHNKHTAFLMGIRVAREMNPRATEAQIYDQALDYMRAVTFSGGRANRPEAQGSNGVIGTMAYGLSGFTVGWLNRLATYVKHWKGSEYQTLTPTERSNARAGALSLLGIQLGAAGLLGMPFLGATLKLLEKTTGQNYTGQLYQRLGQLLNDDKEEGGGLANIVMNGAANYAAASTGLPVDMGSRMAVNGVLGLNSYDGFSGDAVFGPTGSVVASVLGGLKSAANGDLAGAASKIAPLSLKRAIKLWQNGGDATDSGGKRFPLDQGESMAYAMGFNPQRLANLQKYKSIRTSELSAESSSENAQIMEVLDALKSDPQEAQGLVRRIVANSGGAENTQSVARRVAEKAAEAAFPEDVRKVSGQASQHLMQTARVLGVTLPEANQVARQSYVSQTIQMLGGRPVRPRPVDYQNDQLGQEYSPFQTSLRPKRQF